MTDIKWNMLVLHKKWTLPGFQRFTNFLKRRRTLWVNLIHESTCTIKAVWKLVAWFTTWVHKFSLFETKVIAAMRAYGPLMKSGTQVSKPYVGLYTSSFCCHQVGISCHLCPMDQTHCYRFSDSSRRNPSLFTTVPVMLSHVAASYFHGDATECLSVWVIDKAFPVLRELNLVCGFAECLWGLEKKT